ncbi:copper resistance protein B [Xanthomonas melonis]|nr:copper resistance protein B [Xanthomonas melonis]MCD0246678.1 copper resistance protein B [Xanthomonas melonis]
MRALRSLVVGTWLFSASLAAQEHAHAATGPAVHGDHAAALQADGMADAPASQGMQAIPPEASPTARQAMPTMTHTHAQSTAGSPAVPDASVTAADEAAARPAAAPAIGAAEPQTQHDGSAAPMDHSHMDHAGMDHAVMHRADMDHGAMEHQAMGHDSNEHATESRAATEHTTTTTDATTRGAMKHEIHPATPAHRVTPQHAMTHDTMQHDSAMHDGMEHHAMRHGAHAAPMHASPTGTALPREPIPVPTSEEIAAAFAPLQAHAMHGMGINHYVLLDRLEAVDTDRGTGQDWEARAWIGGDIDRLWLRSEGERANGRTQSAWLEAFYGHAISPWWDLLIGARQDLAPDDRRSWAAIGLQGLAPYKFETEATLYLGNGGRAALRLEGEYEVLLTNRLILQPRVEADIALTDDDRCGIGTGLEQVEAGVRLRYEFTRKVAPYIGWVHTRRFGDAAQRDAVAGERPRESQFVAGIRLWF